MGYRAASGRPARLPVHLGGPRQRYITDEERETMAQLREEGWTYQAIADRLGWSYRAVYESLNPEKRKAHTEQTRRRFIASRSAHQAKLDSIRLWQAENVRAGLCKICPQPRVTAIYCARHQQMHKEAVRRYEAQIRRRDV